MRHPKERIIGFPRTPSAGKCSQEQVSADLEEYRPSYRMTASGKDATRTHDDRCAVRSRTHLAGRACMVQGKASDREVVGTQVVILRGQGRRHLWLLGENLGGMDDLARRAKSNNVAIQL